MTPEQIEARRRANKRRKYLSDIGRPATVGGPDVTEVKAKVRSYRERGMTLHQMQQQTGVLFHTLSTSLSRDSSRMYRRTYEALKRLEFEEPDPTAWVAPTGTVRRISSMWHDGFTLDFQAERMGVQKNHLQRLILGVKGRGHVTYRMAKSVAELYGKLAGCEPQEFGIPDRSVRYCRTFALKKGAVPRSCWDADTIDDPEAIPEWTGRCGTEEGYRIHLRDGIPVCSACKPKAVKKHLLGFDGDLLRQLRESRGMSRKLLARTVGTVNETTLQYWETGRSKPQRQDKLDAVLLALDATVEDVTRREA